MQTLGGQVGDERREQRDQDLDLDVVHPTTHVLDDEADQQPEGDPAGRHLREPDQRIRDREAAVRDPGQRDREGDEADPVVDEALPFEHGLEPLRRIHAAHDRRRRHRIGGAEGRQTSAGTGVNRARETPASAASATASGTRMDGCPALAARR